MTTITYKNAFDSLGLSPQQVKTLHKLQYTTATPVQAQAIPMILEKKGDVLAQAQTGTGKTAAFSLPILENIQTEEKTLQACILVPTRELAIQVTQEIQKLKGGNPAKVLSIYGGQNIGIQIRQLKRGVHIVVGTPGRVIDHLQRKTLNLRNVKTVVLDEADEMLNMGFVEPIETILAQTPQDKQTLLFSATMPKRIAQLAQKYMRNTRTISIKPCTQSIKNITQSYYVAKPPVKSTLLCKIIEKNPDFYGIVFCETKRGADKLALQLEKRDINVDIIHGDIHQRKREKVTAKFKAKAFRVLIATDVAARGVHVNDLSHVVNFDLPKNPDIYTHRIGRTGRAGKEGTAISFVTPQQQYVMRMIAQKTKGEIKKVVH